MQQEMESMKQEYNFHIFGNVAKEAGALDSGIWARSEKFSAPLTKTARASYALEEVRLLCLVLRHRPTAPQEMRAKHSKQGMTVLDSDEEDEQTGAESQKLPIKTILKEGLLDEGGDFMELMIGNYNKGSAITGLHKCIVCVIQGDVAVLLSTFLQVVRPVKLLLALTFFGGSVAEKEAEIMHIYRTRLFASFGKLWDPQDLSHIIQDWHFAQALQQCLYSKAEVDPHTWLLSETVNLALGHGQEAGKMNYAHEDSDVLRAF
ncbi:hypothetical protein C8R48DRAFT_676101 [Suillus tomentosus]|nr:hypothetical protein C8R48DRAFT_676101 [Suillus tomentosus]